MSVTVKDTGIRELQRTLSQLSKATARTTLYRVLFRAAGPMDAAWRRNAPENTGLLKRTGGIVKTNSLVGDLAFRTAMRDTGGDKAASVAAKRTALRESNNSFAQITVGTGRNPQATQNEFGNSHQPPRPYFRPAWDETKDEALAIIVRDLGTEIQKTARQVARRRAAKAARG